MSDMLDILIDTKIQIVHPEPFQELTLKLEKLTEDRGKKKKMLENEVTSTLTTQASEVEIFCLNLHLM